MSPYEGPASAAPRMARIPQVGRPVPALLRERTPRRRGRVRPDAHYGCSERGIEQRLRARPRLEHEEGDGGEEQRIEDAEPAVEGRTHQHLHPEEPAVRENA